MFTINWACVSNTFKMKVTSIIILLVLTNVATPAALQAQSFTVSNDSSEKTIDIAGQFNNASVHFAAVKKLPDFSGGKKAWQNFLRANINITIPIANKAIPGSYQVLIQFIVGSDGKLTSIGADSNCGYGMESEVIRCIKKSSAWIPAETSSGKKVSFTFRQAVIFTVKQNDVVIGF